MLIVEGKCEWCGWQPGDLGHGCPSCYMIRRKLGDVPLWTCWGRENGEWRVIGEGRTQEESRRSGRSADVSRRVVLAAGETPQEAGANGRV